MKQLLFIGLIVTFAAAPAEAQIYRVAEMNTDQLRALDRQRTVVILTGGILEQHGPHLPSFSDGYSNEYLTERLAEEIVRRPGMSALLFPTIPLGHEGANEIGGTHVFPGTYSVRRKTLRAIFMDLATELGEQGFKWVIIFHGHGAPFHNLMLDQAGDYFRDTYGGRMVNLRGLLPTAEQLAKLKVPGPPDPGLESSEKAEVGAMDEHAGFAETSRLLFLRADRVGPGYRSLPPLTTNNPIEFFRVARSAGWAGYLSSPRVANANYGARLQQYISQRDNSLALAILDGRLDERDVPRYSRMMTGNKMMMSELAGSTKNEIDREHKQLKWMKKNGVE